MQTPFSNQNDEHQLTITPTYWIVHSEGLAALICQTRQPALCMTLHFNVAHSTLIKIWVIRKTLKHSILFDQQANSRRKY